jgi:signal peptidase I
LKNRPSNDGLNSQSDFADGKNVILPILSGSMNPVLPPGGIVQIESAAWENCKPGDIIVFLEGKRMLAHRYLFRLRIGRRRWIYQKGDANMFGQMIRGEQVVGIIDAAWDASGNEVYRRKESSRTTGTMCRHILRDIVARMLFIPRLFKRVLCRMLGR